MTRGAAPALPFRRQKAGPAMLAQFIRLAVDDASEASELQQALEREGARVWRDQNILQVLWPRPDAGARRLQGWATDHAGREISVLDERPVEVAGELFPKALSRPVPNRRGSEGRPPAPTVRRQDLDPVALDSQTGPRKRRSGNRVGPRARLRSRKPAGT